MKKIFIWTFMTLMLGLWSSVSAAQSTRSLILLANSEDYQRASSFLNLLRENEVSFTRVTAIDFEKNKNAGYIVIMGGPESAEGIGKIIREVLKPDEIESLKDDQLGKVFGKLNLWREGQKILIFAGKDSDAVEKARTENKMVWMPALRDWFDLQINWEEMTY